MLEQLSELKSIIENQEFEKYNISDEDLDDSSVGTTLTFKVTSVFIILLVIVIIYFNSIGYWSCILIDKKIK